MNTIKNHSQMLTGLMGFLLAVVVAGCGSDGGGSTQPGVLGVSITDAPACGFDAVNVTVSKVRVHQSDNASENAAGWTDITLNPPRKINLLDLNNGALASLGETPLEAGHYTQLRLVLDRNTGQSLANSVVLENTTAEIALDTPSAIQTGIKLIHQFTVGSGQRVDLLLDFDACKSIVQTGNGAYKLKPVIKVIPFEQNGIVGFVDKTLPNVVVSAQDNNGEIVRATVPNADGKFFLAHLDPTTCPTTCYNVVITADDHATAVISGVPVPNSTSVTIINTSGAPLTLDGSTPHSIGGTVTLNPPSATDETVFVAAKQTFGSVPPLTVVTVKSQVAVPQIDPQTNLPTGDYQYALALPIAAPSLWQYSASLPIALSPQAAVAGKYTVQASATDYQPQSLIIPDISVVNTAQNFTLTP
jgi:uncharacterized protein DUF4382